MKTYARVDQGIVMELFSTDDDITKMFNPALVWVDVSAVEPQPAYGWIAIESDGQWTFTEQDLPV